MGQPAETQIRIKVKTEPLVVKNYQNLHNSCLSDLGTAGSTYGKLNFKKFKKIPKASVLKNMPHIASASVNSTAFAMATNNGASTSNTRLRQKKAKLEASQFVSFKNEPFDVDSQFLSFVSQNR